MHGGFIPEMQIYTSTFTSKGIKSIIWMDLKTEITLSSQIDAGKAIENTKHDIII